MPTQVFSKFNGLWARGPIDDTPPDHSCDCQNNEFIAGNVNTRRGIGGVEYAVTNTIATAVYKPLPPFAASNIPRQIRLTSGGDLYDVQWPASPIYSNVNMTNFSLVNFFGRCYISPNDGKVGLNGVNIQVYAGLGNPTRDVGGAAPTTALVVAASATAGDIDPATYFISFAFETDTGFITRPAPWTYSDTYGFTAWDISSIDTGPAGTVARWIIVTRGFQRADLSSPPNVNEASLLPQFFLQRIADNTTTTLSAVTFFDQALVDSADYLQTQFEDIASGVSLLDYKGRMIVMGQYADPSLVRVSQIGEPESISETSGFIITDPSDSTGVRCAVEFRNLLYLFKLNRGYMTEDNGEEASTWQVVNFEKAIGTECNGIADVLDAKGSNSEGFLIASQGGLNFFNGIFGDQELSYKIRDFWLRINQTYFHLVQVYNDPINKRIYVLLPLDTSSVINVVLFGDYRNGMTPQAVKWSPWYFGKTVKAMSLMTSITSSVTTFQTFIAATEAIYLFDNGSTTLDRDDAGIAIDSYYTLGPSRFAEGLSQFDRVRVRVIGDGTLLITTKSQDLTSEVSASSITMSTTPGREYAQLINRVNEQCYVKFRNATLNKYYQINAVALEGQFYSDERPRT